LIAPASSWGSTPSSECGCRISRPREYREGSLVGIDDLRRGDLVFFDRLDHVGIYAGCGRFIHAPCPGGNVCVSSLASGWYADRYDGGVRIG